MNTTTRKAQLTQRIQRLTRCHHEAAERGRGEHLAYIIQQMRYELIRLSVLTA